MVARSDREIIDESARQKLTQDEIEELKRDGTGAGKDIIAKLLLSHTALDQKTSFSLAKYKLLKTKKYIRRFQVLPLDAAALGKWMVEEKDAARVLDMREEMMALVGCWANVHYGGEDTFLGGDETVAGEDADKDLFEDIQKGVEPSISGRWLVVDDTGGLLVASMAERMGILYQEQEAGEPLPAAKEVLAGTRNNNDGEAEINPDGSRQPKNKTAGEGVPSTTSHRNRHHHQPRGSDFRVPYSQTNTITLIHSSSQPNLSLMSYYGFDVGNPNHPPHPLTTHLLPLSWLQLVDPSLDSSYSTPPPMATPDEIAAWKPNQRGNYHRKRRRYARARHIVDAARAGGFSGLVCASTMDAVSILRHAVPLLAGGSPVAVYSASLEPLVELADCFSVARRTAWAAAGDAGGSLEHWPGSDDFPLNPTLLLGSSIQTSRARRWQVLPARTHPTMTDRGGAEGFVFTAWRARPAEGRVEARGRYKRRRKDDKADTPADTGDTGDAASL